MNVKVADILMIDTKEFAEKALMQFVHNKIAMSSYPSLIHGCDHYVLSIDGTMKITVCHQGYTMDDDTHETIFIPLSDEEKREVIGLVHLYGHNEVEVFKDFVSWSNK